MNLDIRNTTTPDTMDIFWTEEKLVYKESYETGEEVDVRDLVDTTKALAEEYANRISEESDTDVDVEVETEVVENLASVEVVMTPGKPGDMPELGLIAIAGEVMATLAISNPEMWDTVVKATKGTAKEMMVAQAKTNAGP